MPCSRRRYRHCSHSMRSRVYATVERPSVRPSVRPSHQAAARRCCGFAAVGSAARGCRSTATRPAVSCSSRAAAADAGSVSATLRQEAGRTQTRSVHFAAQRPTTLLLPLLLLQNSALFVTDMPAQSTPCCVYEYCYGIEPTLFHTTFSRHHMHTRNRFTIFPIDCKSIAPTSRYFYGLWMRNLKRRQ